MRPVDYQPPLTRWRHTWRLLLMLFIAGVGLAARVEDKWATVPMIVAMDLALGAAATVVVMVWRRRYPVAVATATNLISVVSATASGPAALGLVSLSTRRRWREIVPQLVLAMATAIAAEWVQRIPRAWDISFVDISFIAVALCLAVAWGLYIGSRRELLASWQARAELAENEQNARVREARIAEQGRIAREMHDVLAHRISTVSMHAGALAIRDDLSPQQVRETAQLIHDTSHQALTDLREVLGVLREGPGDADPEQPQASAADLGSLIEDNLRAGMRIDFDPGIDPAALPSAFGRTLYRCVQEGLTNARKHAPESRVRVTLTGQPGAGVDLTVENPLSVHSPRTAAVPVAPESGFGLIGLAERVALHGGRMASGISDRQSFVLSVWLPWQI